MWTCIEKNRAYRKSVRRNIKQKQLKEMTERILEERALIHAHNKKKNEMNWHSLQEGDSLLRMVIERKWRGSGKEEDENR